LTSLTYVLKNVANEMKLGELVMH